MTYRVRGVLLVGLLLGLLTKAVAATDDLLPEIELLEFLGTIAGLEGMGIEIDELLAGSVLDEVVDTETEAQEDKPDE